MSTLNPRDAREATRFRARRLFLGVGPEDAARDAAEALVPDLGSWCEVSLLDAGELRTLEVRDDETSTRVAPVLDSFPDFVTRRAEALAGAPALVLRGAGPQVCLLAAIREHREPLGTIALVTQVADEEIADHLGVVEQVATLAGAAVGRAQLRRRARDAARRTQRVASQLHQLLAASIAIGGLQDEDQILAAVSQRVRGVFDADVAVVTLRGERTPTYVVAAGSGGAEFLDGLYVPDSLGLPSSARSSAPATIDGEWLVVPIPVRRGESQGSLALRREASPFEDDDLEVATLLAQTAASALASARLHRSVARSEERLRVLVDAAPVAIVETDLRGVVQMWNRAAQGLFGWPEPVGKEGLAPPEFPDETVDVLGGAWAEARRGAVVVGREVVGAAVNGERRDLAVSVAALPATTGHESGMLTVVEDVTDRRQLMEELRHAQRMEVIGQLSSSVAHDFNNLLTLISGYSELLAADLAGQDRSTKLVLDIQSTTQRAATLTGKLLTMGRKKLPNPVVFSPAAAVRGIEEVLDRIVGADVRLVLELNAGAGNVRADPDQFEQIIMNLATNARDAMPEGGTLRISVDPVAGAEGLPEVRIVVVDTGQGMDDVTLARCFEPLFTTKGPSRGTGLGLPAARRVVTEAGGTIRVESALGVGTRFELRMPAVDEQVAEVAPDAATPRRHGPASVLLAEDEAGIRDLVGRVLDHNDFEVHAAENGEHALQVADSLGEPVDVLVSDVVMGGMSGAELARELQAKWPGLLVVLMSGNVDDSVLEELAPGTSAFLAKPFRPSELLDVVDRLLSFRDGSKSEPAPPMPPGQSPLAGGSKR
jgi:PAS domain S-box-containing protein